jgi:hypothetical protein
MTRSAIIDLYPCETEPDGTCVYRPPLEALAVQLTGGVIWLMTVDRRPLRVVPRMEMNYLRITFQVILFPRKVLDLNPGNKECGCLYASASTAVG